MAKLKSILLLVFDVGFLGWFGYSHWLLLAMAGPLVPLGIGAYASAMKTPVRRQKWQAFFYRWAPSFRWAMVAASFFFTYWYTVDIGRSPYAFLARLDFGNAETILFVLYVFSMSGLFLAGLIFMLDDFDRLTPTDNWFLSPMKSWVVGGVSLFVFITFLFLLFTS